MRRATERDGVGARSRSGSQLGHLGRRSGASSTGSPPCQWPWALPVLSLQWFRCRLHESRAHIPLDRRSFRPRNYSNPALEDSRFVGHVIVAFDQDMIKLINYSDLALLGQLSGLWDATAT